MEDFNQLLLSLAAQNNTAPQEEDESPAEDATDNQPEDSEDGVDIESLQAENEALKGQLKEFQDQSNVVDAQDDYYNYMLTQDMEDPNYAMDLITSDDLFEGLKDNPASSAGWLKKKDSSVNIEGLSTRLITYLESLPESLRNKLIATSGNDSDVHDPNSKHYQNKAIDLRYDSDVYNYILKDPNFKKSGLKTLDPNHGTASHIHLQEYKTGGKYAVGGELEPITVTGSIFKRLPNGQTVQSYKRPTDAPQSVNGQPLDIYPNTNEEKLLDYDGNVIALKTPLSSGISKVVFTDAYGKPDMSRGEYNVPTNKFDKTKKIGLDQLFNIDNFDSYRKK